MYETHTDIATTISSTNNIIKIIDLIYQQPVVTMKTIAKETGIPTSSLTRYLSMLVEKDILSTDEKSRNRTYYCYDLLSVLRQ